MRLQALVLGVAAILTLHVTGADSPRARQATEEPAVGTFPAGRTHSADYRRSLEKLCARLKEPAPAVSARERAESLDWMEKANPEIRAPLVGHHVIVMATEGFARRAAQNDFILRLDLAYEVLRHLWGVDPCSRVGRRFVVWPDPARAGGHNCNGQELRIAIGVDARDDADCFETFFHELTHGFQFAHPAGHLGINGFGEGWAEFMQAVVSDHLAPLGAPFEGRFMWYSRDFPRSGEAEYLRTRLPIEEIVAYNPSAGLFMELVNTTLDAEGRPDWAGIRTLLQAPIQTPRWTPWHLWPARMALDCMAAFGEAKARPILAKYRFPLDRASLEAARSQDSGQARPDASPRKPLLGWSRIGPIADPQARGMDWDPLGADDMAWRWRESFPKEPRPPLSPGRAHAWSSVEPDEHGQIVLDDRGGQPGFFYLATTLPEAQRKPLTLFIGSDDDCAVWLDGRLVHLFRGSRACTPDYPDVAYADATGTHGQIVVLVVNGGGPAGFSMAVAEGGLFFEGFEQRFSSSDAHERAAAVRYVASRRHQQPVTALLARASKDKDDRVRAAAQWWPDLRPKDGGDYREAEDAYARGSIRGGFFGLNAGTSGNQCVARHWGSNREHWLSLPLEVKRAGEQRVRIRYACPNDAALRVRLRQGDRVLFTSETRTLPASGKDWNVWAWHELETPSLERGSYAVELIEPERSPDVDMIGIVAR